MEQRNHKIEEIKKAKALEHERVSKYIAFSLPFSTN